MEESTKERQPPELQHSGSSIATNNRNMQPKQNKEHSNAGSSSTPCTVTPKAAIPAPSLLYGDQGWGSELRGPSETRCLKAGKINRVVS